MARVDGRPGAELHLRGTAVEAADPLRPQPGQDVRVVAVPEERLGVRADGCAVEVRHDGDLVVATDRREDGAHLRVTESGVEVGRAICRRGAQPAGRRVLHGHQPGHVGEPAHRLLVHRRAPRPERRTRARARRPGRRGLALTGATTSRAMQHPTTRTGCASTRGRRRHPGCTPRSRAPLWHDGSFRTGPAQRGAPHERRDARPRAAGRRDRGRPERRRRGHVVGVQRGARHPSSRGSTRACARRGSRWRRTSGAASSWRSTTSGATRRGVRPTSGRRRRPGTAEG